MSDFVDALVDMLPEHSKLKNTRNPLRQVLDLSVGEWFDNQSVLEFYDNLFVQTATGAWLDLHGRDYNIPRRLGESDEDYRARIVMEKLDNLTSDTLIREYGLTLYSFVEGFDVAENILTSDNQYISVTGFMAEASDEVKKILRDKFVLDGGIVWIGDL